MSDQTQPASYFNIVDNLMSMHMTEREQMFRLFTDHKELFDKMLSNAQIFDVMLDPTTELEHPLVIHYQQWARDQLLPK